MDEINDGGPAFPVPTDKYGSEEFYLGTTGMMLRDWFAGQTLLEVAGMNPNLPGDAAKCTEWPGPKELAERRAKWAYIQADAMLAARGAK